MEVFYSDHYTIDLPEKSRFPMAKYKMLRDYLIQEKIISEIELKKSPLASRDLLLLAHTAQYVDSMRDGTVSLEIIKRIGFPWSPALYQRICATVGGALESAL